MMYLVFLNGSTRCKALIFVNYIRSRSHNFFAKKCYRQPSWR